MSPFPLRNWTQRRKSPMDNQDHEFLISTDTRLIPIPALIDAFAQDYFYWGYPMPEEEMKRMVDTSLCFGLYLKDKVASDPSPQTLIGFARLVTDTVIFAYLTDVYVLPEYQGTGLGTWMMGCVDEVLSTWPHLRKVMFFTRYERSRSYYEKVLGAENIGLDKAPFIMARKGARSI